MESLGKKLRMEEISVYLLAKGKDPLGRERIQEKRDN